MIAVERERPVINLTISPENREWVVLTASGMGWTRSRLVDEILNAVRTDDKKIVEVFVTRKIRSIVPKKGGDTDL